MVIFCFFFQAEDGIRDLIVTGVQTCALPISNRIAEIGTPCGSSHSGASVGHCDIGVQYREFGCAALSGDPGSQSRPFQSIRCCGSPSRPSHQMSLSSVSATLVKTVLPASMVFIAFG